MIWMLLFFLCVFLVLAAVLLDGKSAPPPPDESQTEAMAEVVRIHSIEPHGNADKLEIARFETRQFGLAGYEVVVQRGQFKPGDLACYYSVDCIVPIDGPFKFLGTRLDGAGKTHYRLRAARLRGKYSQGLLIPYFEVEGEHGKLNGFGQKLWLHNGVTYHQSPEPGQPTQVGEVKHKAKPQPFPIYGVSSLRKDPQLLEGAAKLFVTEKIHGCNYRFGWVRRRIAGVPVGWKFVVGSHRCIKGDGSGGYYGEDVFTEFATRNNLAERTKAYPGYTFYGELYGHTYGGKRIQDLTYGRDASAGPGLALFDVLTPTGYLEPEPRYDLFDKLRLPGVPIVSLPSGPDSAAVDLSSLAEGHSLVYSPQIREGIVVESVGLAPRVKAKLVGEGYYLRKEA
jgi:RNA ligase (TIGR02306 family)